MQNDFYDRALRYSSTQWYNQWPMGVPGAVGLAQLPPLTQANHIDKKDSGKLYWCSNFPTNKICWFSIITKERYF